MDTEAERGDIEKFDPEEKGYCNKLLDEIDKLQAEVEQMKKIVESVVDYRNSTLFDEWNKYISTTPPSEQVDWFVYQARAAKQALTAG